MSDPDPDPVADALAPRRDRLAIAAAFVLFGGVIGMWFVHVPVVALRLHMQTGILGLALLIVGLTGLTLQPLATRLVSQYGARRMAMVWLPIVIAALLLPILAQSTQMLFLSLFLAGLVTLPTNVALNTQASEFEIRVRRPTMSFFHGSYSLGGMIGSVLGGLLIQAGYGDGRGAGVVSLLAIVLAIWLTRQFLPSQTMAKTQKSHGFSWPVPALMGLALMALLANIVEGSVGDWSALYLTTVKHSGPGLAASGFAMFSFAMAAFRFIGGPLISRIGDRATVVGGGVLIALGMGIVIIMPWPIASASGFLIAALGTANIAPIVMSSAARMPGISPSAGIGAVASALVIGLLSGPPVIGFVAQGLGLSVGLGLTILIGVYIAGFAWARHWEAPHQTTEAGA